MRKGQSRLDQIAELMAADLTVAQMAERAGLTRGGVRAAMSRIRAGLGWQAQ
jgi:DNA-binding CsgD family transcriptional regulator